MIDALPKLNTKQTQCLMTFLTSNCSQIEAFSSVFMPHGNKNTLYKEASKFFNSPKIIPWLKHYQENTAKTIQEELNYTARQHFDELNNLKNLALNCLDKQCNPDVKTMLKAEELKGKLAGFYKNDTEETVSNITVMNDIKLDGETIKLKVGSDVRDISPSAQNDGA